MNGLHNVYQNHSCIRSPHQKTMAISSSAEAVASEEKIGDAIPFTFCLQFKVTDPRFIPSDDT
jgi:hypothetical protein